MTATRRSSPAARTNDGDDAIRRHAQDASRLLRVLGNEQRLLVLCDLVEGERSVSSLLSKLPLSQSALSQHLAVMRDAGIVEVRREGLQAFYRLAQGPALAVMSTLHAIYCEEGPV